MDTSDKRVPQPTMAERPAWRTLAEVWDRGPERDGYTFSPATVARLRPLDASVDRNSDAEYAFYQLHSRFQRWAEEYFFSDERILAFVPWIAPAAWWQRLGRRVALGGRQPAEGALVLTDRHTLFLRDDAEPVGGAVYWGYRVQVIAHERLRAVALGDAASGQVELRLTLQALAHRETLRYSFPAAAATALHHLAGLLASFLPRGDDRRLRRVGRILPAQAALLAPALVPGRSRRPQAVGTAVERAALGDILAALLAAHPAPDGTTRRVHARGIGVESGQDNAPQLLAVTREHLFLIPLPGRGEPLVQPLASITSATLRRSVLGNHIAWATGGERETAALCTFPPVAVATCVALFAVLRQGLALLPAWAREPDPPARTTEAAGATREAN